MKLISKIFVLIGVFIIVFIFGREYIKEPESKTGKPVIEQKKEEPRKEQEYVSLILNFGDSDIKKFNNIVLRDNFTVFDILKEIIAANNINFDYKDYGGDMGVFVNAIGEKTNNFNSGYYWQYWINGQYSKVGASSYKLKAGDVVEWKYAKSELIK